MKKKVVLQINLVLAGLVLMVLGCTPRTNNPIPTTVEAGIEQATPTLGNGTGLGTMGDMALNIEDRAVTEGIIIGEVYFDDIPISRFFREPFLDILGEPLSVSMDGYDFDYGSLSIWGRFDYITETFTIIQLMSISDVHLVRVNDVSLDSNREELIALLGNPIDHYEYPEYEYIAGIDPWRMRYHISSYALIYTLDIWFELDDTVRRVTIRTSGL